MIDVRTATRVLRLAWVLPLSLLSFAFYRVVRLALRPVRMASLRRRREVAGQWRLNATERDLKGLRLALMMTTGPRANPHAIIGVIDLLAVRRSISLDVAAASRAARSWSAVIYRLPEAVTVAAVGSADAPFTEPWRTVPLPPGRYAIAMRHYHARDPVEFPAVRVDGADQVLARAIPGAARSFEAVRDKRGLFYLCLHYYVFHALDHRDWLPAAFVEREFLPAGNPQTRFRFGAVRRGQSITLTLAPALLATHAVFFTLYNRHSFPVTWYPIADEHHTTAPCACAGFYLVRIQQLAAQAGRFDDAWIDVTVDP
jgi:hypothetical protein